MKAVCPDCGRVFDVQTRAEMNSGTQTRLKRIDDNKLAILELLARAREPLTAIKAATHLNSAGVKMKKRITKEGKTTTGTFYWGQHDVQMNLSLLVGNDLATAIGPSEYKFEDVFFADPAPVYYLDEAQKLKSGNIFTKPKEREDLKWNVIRSVAQKGKPWWIK
jgi:hypothetical protein